MLLLLLCLLSDQPVIETMDHPHCPHVLPAPESDICPARRARSLNTQLRRENKELKARVERLRVLLSDLPEFEEEKRRTLEALRRSSGREQDLKERLKEEWVENACLLDALADLDFLIQTKNHRRLRVENLKRELFKAHRGAQETEQSLAEKSEVIRRRHAEIGELIELIENCAAHVEENAARIEEAEKSLRQWERLGRLQREAFHQEDLLLPPPPSSPLTPPPPPPSPSPLVPTVYSKARHSWLKDMLVTLCSFFFTLLFLLFVISSVLPLFIDDAKPISCTKVLLDRTKVRFSKVLHNEPPLI